MSELRSHRTQASGRGIKIALAVSVSLNLLVAGLVAGVFLASDRVGPSARTELRALGLGPFALALEREDRAELRDRIADEPPVRDRAVIGGALRDLQDILRADPFDRLAAATALRQSRAAAEALQGRGHRVLLDQIESMSPADRAALADRLDRALRRVRPDRPTRVP